jgi:hypothetical protein
MFRKAAADQEVHDRSSSMGVELGLGVASR